MTSLLLTLVLLVTPASDTASLGDTSRSATATPREARAFSPRSADRVRALWRSIQFYHRAQFDRAESAAFEVLDVFPADTYALTIIGAARLGRRDYKNAEAIFTRYTELYPLDAMARFYLGLCYHYLGDRQRASSEYWRALVLDPGLQPARDNLAQLNAVEQH